MARSWRARASRSPTTPSLAPPVSRSAAVAVVLPCRPPDTAETRDGGGEHGVEIVRSPEAAGHAGRAARASRAAVEAPRRPAGGEHRRRGADCPHCSRPQDRRDRKSTRLNSSHPSISYAVFCLKKKKTLSMMFIRNKKKKKDK